MGNDHRLPKIASEIHYRPSDDGEKWVRVVTYTDGSVEITEHEVLSVKDSNLSMEYRANGEA